MLYVHAAPLSLHVGDYFPLLLSAGDRFCFFDGEKAVLYAVAGRGGKRTVLVVPNLFGCSAFRGIFCPDVPVADAVWAVRSGALPDLYLAPSTAGVRIKESSDARCLPAVMANLCACTAKRALPAVSATPRAMLESILSMPPLCTYPTRLMLPDYFGALEMGVQSERWCSAAYCLALFLCRTLRDADLTFLASGRAADAALIISAKSSLPLPVGFASLDVLLTRFPDAAELHLAELFSLQSGFAIDVFVTSEGVLGFSLGTDRFDPAQIGLKQFADLIRDEEAAEAAGEWCRLLLAAVQGCR